MSLRVRRIGLPVLVLALAACGSSAPEGTRTKTTSTTALAPADALRSGVARLGQGSSLRLSVHYTGDEAKLRALIAGAGRTAADRADAARLVQVFTKTTLTVTLHDTRGGSLGRAFDLARAGFAAGHGSPGPSTRSVDQDYALTLAGAELAEVRSVDGSFYAKVDAPLFAGLSASEDADHFDLGELRSKGRQQVDAALRALPSTGALDFLPKAAAGAWIKVSAQSITNLSSLLSGAAAARGIDTKGAAVLEGLATTLHDLPGHGLAVTRAGASSGPVDTLSVVTTGKDLTDAFIPLLQQLSSEVKAPAPGEVPDEPVTLSATVDHGALSRLLFDATPLLPEEARAQAVATDTTLGVELDASTAATTVTAPADAVDVDLLTLFSQLGSLDTGS